MRKTYGTIALALACGLPALALPATYNDWGDVESELVSKKMLHQQIPMRDGVKLDADIYLPHGKPPFPTMLYRSPYIPDLFSESRHAAGQCLERHCWRVATPLFTRTSGPAIGRAGSTSSSRTRAPFRHVPFTHPAAGDAGGGQFKTRGSAGALIRSSGGLKMRVLSSSLLLAGTFLFGGADPLFAQDAGTTPSIEQLPASVYARAEAVVPQNVRKLIYGLSVRPQWIGKTSRFWYEKQTREGRDYLLVDAAAGAMRPLFDRDALIGALAGATGKSIERKTFKLTGLKVDDKSGTLRFAQDGKEWKYDPSALVLTPNADPADGERSPDGAWRALVRDGNLFVISTKDGSERQLTADGTPDAPYATPVIDPKIMIAQGTSHPVVPPALSWSPDSRRIATFRLSLTGARRLALVQSTPPGGAQPRVFEYFYTLPGDTQTPLAQGMIFDLETDKRIEMALAPEPVLYYFGPEFVWSADGKAVFERVAERGYKKLKLYRVDAVTGASSLLSEDRSDTYVDTWSQFWFYDEKSDTVYWTADETGYFHLYAIDAHSGARRQLTSGDWVVRSVAGVDAPHGKLLIVGTGREAGRNPYLRHLYAVPRKGGAVKQLTPEPLITMWMSLLMAGISSIICRPSTSRRDPCYAAPATGAS